MTFFELYSQLDTKYPNLTRAIHEYERATRNDEIAKIIGVGPERKDVRNHYFNKKKELLELLANGLLTQ